MHNKTSKKQKLTWKFSDGVNPFLHGVASRQQLQNTMEFSPQEIHAAKG